MIYLMKCDKCDKTLEIGCPMNRHDDIIKPGIGCQDELNYINGCGSQSKRTCTGILRQVIVPPRHMFVRGSFPATGNEVQLPTEHGVDIKFQDKYHARDYLEDHGLVSKWIENDM